MFGFVEFAKANTNAKKPQ